MKKFEPLYRLVRVGMATKPEKASRQQRMWHLVVLTVTLLFCKEICVDLLEY